MIKKIIKSILNFIHNLEIQKKIYDFTNEEDSNITYDYKMGIFKRGK